MKGAEIIGKILVIVNPISKRMPILCRWKGIVKSHLQEKISKQSHGMPALKKVDF